MLCTGCVCLWRGRRALCGRIWVRLLMVVALSAGSTIWGTAVSEPLSELSEAEAGQLLAVATLYVDSFGADELMSLAGRMRLQQVEDILARYGRRW